MRAGLSVQTAVAGGRGSGRDDSIHTRLIPSNHLAILSWPVRRQSRRGPFVDEGPSTSKRVRPWSTGESRHWAAASGCSRPDNDLEEEEAQRGTGINTIQSCVSRGRPSSLESRLDDERAVWPATASRPTTNYHQHPFSGWPWCPPVSFDPPSMIDHSTAAPLVITCWCHRCRTVPYS